MTWCRPKLRTWRWGKNWIDEFREWDAIANDTRGTSQVKQLAQWIKESKHLVAFTGAGWYDCLFGEEEEEAVAS